MSALTQQEIIAAMEAILFVAGEALPTREIAAALDISIMETDAAARALETDYDYHQRGFKLMRFDGKLQLATRPLYTSYVERALTPVKKQPLTQPLMETLAVIAYRQPITRMEIEAIRGVRCERSLLRLAQHNLIEEVGRKDVVGRPILYGTTEEFLRHFGIQSIDELPVLVENPVEQDNAADGAFFLQTRLDAAPESADIAEEESE